MNESVTKSVIEPGTVLAGKFRIEQVLGQGGMGVVVAAHHLQLDERVALKFLLPEALGNPEAVARFAREARAAVKIKSEHVARVTDVGTLDTGSPYMVMEFLNGTDLGELVHSRGALPIGDAVEYVLQACEAVAEAHALGIVHRDLKPANLFLTRRADGSASIKVLDFGISKVTTGADSQLSMTRTATVMGSPLYMSPEQMASAKDVDTRTDIWAIGAILHELLTGSVPFLADTMPQLCAKILQEPPPPLRNGRPDAPEELQLVVQRCLQKTPGLRYPSVAELAADLLPHGPSRCRVSVERITRVITAAGLTDSNLSLPHSRAPASAHAVGTTQQAWGKSSGARQAGGKWLTALIAVGVLAAAGIAAALLGVFDATAEAPALAGSPSGDTAGAALESPPRPERGKPSEPEQAATPDEPEPGASSSAPGSAVASSTPPLPEPAATPAAAAKPPVARSKPRSSGAIADAKRVSPPPAPAAARAEPKTRLPAVDLYQDRK